MKKRQKETEKIQRWGKKQAETARDEEPRHAEKTAQDRKNKKAKRRSSWQGETQEETPYIS